MRLRVRLGKDQVNFNVGYRVQLDKWVTDSQRCKAGATHRKKEVVASEINVEIPRLETLAESVFKAFEVQNYLLGEKEYRNAFNEAMEKCTE